MTWDSNDTSEFLCTLGVEFWGDSAILRDYGFTIDRLTCLCLDDQRLFEKHIGETSHREAILDAAVWICVSAHICVFDSVAGRETVAFVGLRPQTVCVGVVSFTSFLSFRIIIN